MSTPVAASACANCETSVQGPYCAACGQRHKLAQERSLRGLLAIAFEQLTSYDSRIWASLRALALKPGELTLAFIEGRHARYLSPVAVFLTATFLFYLSNHTKVLLDSDILSSATWFSRLGIDIDARVTAFVKTEQLTRDAFAARYEAEASSLRQSLLILFAPLASLLTWVALRRRDRYFVDHVVYLMHLSSFVMLFMVASRVASRLIATIDAWTQGAWGLASTSPAMSAINVFGSMAIVLGYLLLSIHRAYPARWFTVCLRGTFLLVALMIGVNWFGKLVTVFGLWWLTS